MGEQAKLLLHTFQYTVTRRWLRFRFRFAYPLQSGFNTQSPEGGCTHLKIEKPAQVGFNTQSPEGGCAPPCSASPITRCFNTQSPEGGCCPPPLSASASLSFNTQSPEGGCRAKTRKRRNPNRFNTQSPEGGCLSAKQKARLERCFNTQSPEGGCVKSSLTNKFLKLFQHTAARRRLRNWLEISVSIACFNTQPPEGGCKGQFTFDTQGLVSTHSRPKAAALSTSPSGLYFLFQHTAARRRLPTERQRREWENSFNTQPPEGGCYHSAR